MRTSLRLTSDLRAPSCSRGERSRGPGPRGSDRAGTWDVVRLGFVSTWIRIIIKNNRGVLIVQFTVHGNQDAIVLIMCNLVYHRSLVTWGDAAPSA